MATLYELTEAGVFATEYTRGPWDPNAQHGGAPAALLMRAFEQTDPDPTLMLTRVTYELLRPVPLGQLSVAVGMARPGRRVQLLEGTISTPDGVAVVRARAQRVRRAPVDAGGAFSADPGASGAAGGTPSPPASWSTAEPMSFGDFPGVGPKRIVFPGDAVEIRFVSGAFVTLGPSTAWFRMRVPLIAGEPVSPLQRLAAAADFPNGIATELDWTRYVFINPDLTLYIEREPVGEWIALTASMTVSAGGGAVSQAVLSDEHGRVGRSLQSLYVAER